jgi:putative ABC transport system ATP-binding protein
MIALKQVSKTYPGGVAALRDVSLTIDRGELAGVVGPSGSGKSTMLHLIGALDLPSNGSVTIAGHDLSRLSDRQLSALRGRTTGFVFQAFHLAAGVPALDNVADGLLYAGITLRERRRRAERALELVGLSHRRAGRPHQLSGGERQRIAIARAFIKDAPVLILDEPTSSIDSRTELVILDALDRLMVGRTTFIIAHRLSTIRCADHILVLDKGHIVERGAHADLLTLGGLYAQTYRIQSSGLRREKEEVPA